MLAIQWQPTRSKIHPWSWLFCL